MKVILDIQDSKAAFIMELLKNFAFVKTFEISEEDAPVLTNIQKDAIDQGLADLENGRVLSNIKVMEDTKKRYPHLFKKG